MLGCLGSVTAQVIPDPIQETISDEDAFLDSLALLFPEQNSSLSFRLGFTNHAYFAGRDYGIKQSMLMPSISYQHSSGLYADLTGLSFSQSTPMYELTMASVGYLGTVGENFWFFGEYSRTFLTKPDPEYPNPIPNALTLYGMYDFGKVMPSVAYAFMFGDENAQRIIPSISGYFAKKTKGFIDRISFSPSVSATIGNAKSYYFTYVPTVIRSPQFPFIQTVLNPILNENDHFGLMAFTISTPVTFRMKSLRFTLTPNFIKPVRLYQAEDISVGRKLNFSASLFYTLGL